MSGKTRFYVVWRGRRSGIYTSWEACRAQVDGFPGAEFHSFPNRAEAELALVRGCRPSTARRSRAVSQPVAARELVRSSLAADAACSGNPGRLEWRVVRTSSAREILHQGPFLDGTNNIGEFLAIVDALIWLDRQGNSRPVYSDSRTAIAWVRAGRSRTRQLQNRSNAPLFRLIALAEDWLSSHPDHSPVFIWDTSAWGEIPADFHRK
jgi:ribonuclease HI